ncbi:hypothetical protein [Curtobacterium sp. MCBD17_040]|uniref:hypothetical protein n=1 Tax=Curtobacterium sp. MCBD17_040 TaxID=2175674 RepID=UPI000DA72951|nr:hypothetical protein [Curtobacterium sp. MCBD17_040]WIB64369.1 hypothetical protein DEI94_04010 [Curtobacterium sp. MCBD17_040]
MAAILAAPAFLQDVRVTVAGSNYETAISSVAFTPKTDTVTFKGGTPSATYNFQTNADWTADLTFAQDWTTANSLSNYLFNNQGKQVSMTFIPNQGGPTITATVTCQSGPVGGAIGAVATSTVSLGVTGTPTFSATTGS